VCIIVIIIDDNIITVMAVALISTLLLGIVISILLTDFDSFPFLNIVSANK